MPRGGLFGFWGDSEPKQAVKNKENASAVL